MISLSFFYYLLDFLLTLWRILDGFFSHYFHVVFQCNTRLRSWHQTKAYLFLFFFFFLNTFLSSKFSLFLFCKIEWYCHLFYLFYLIVFKRYRMLDVVCYSFKVKDVWIFGKIIFLVNAWKILFTFWQEKRVPPLHFGCVLYFNLQLSNTYDRLSKRVILSFFQFALA